MPVGEVQTPAIQIVQGAPLTFTRIVIPRSTYSNAVAGAGFVWSTQGNAFAPKILRVDPNTNQLTEISRFSGSAPKLLVNDDSFWYSDGVDLRRVDIETNEAIATIESVGIPFSIDVDAVWAYNDRTEVVSAIDVRSNQIVKQLAVPGRPHNAGSFAFGAGSLWQFVFTDGGSWWQEKGLWVGPLTAAVRRIDPLSNAVIAEIPVGPFTNTVDPYVSADRIHFVAGAIWVLGPTSEASVASPEYRAPVAKRIDIETHRVTDTIALAPGQVTAKELAVGVGCHEYLRPRTPVYWDGGIWISVYCGWAKAALLKVDTQTNQITEEVVLELNPEPSLVAAGGSLWGVTNDYVFRLNR
jgi:hypothetical protein